MKILKKVTLEEATGRVLGPIDDVITALINAKMVYKDYDLTLRTGGGYDEMWIDLVGVRYETEEEFNTRAAKELEKAEKALERKKAKFEKLKKELYDTP